MKILTHLEMSSRGGHARAAKLSKARQKAIARKGADARWRAHRAKKLKEKAA